MVEKFGAVDLIGFSISVVLLLIGSFFLVLNELARDRSRRELERLRKLDIAKKVGDFLREAREGKLPQ